MKSVLVVAVLLFVVEGTIWTIPLDETVPDRENEPDSREYFTMEKQDLVQQFCVSVRQFQEELIALGGRPRNTVLLSGALVGRHDSNNDNCISDNEIRNLAEAFGGDITAYRMLFENILDENKSGCVEAEELNSLILDCIMPSAYWMEQVPNKYEIPFDEEEQHREFQRILGGEKLEEEEETDLTLEEKDISDEERIDRRAMMEEMKKEKKVVEEPRLNPALKELLCSMVKRQNTDLKVGLEELSRAASLDDQHDNLTYDEFVELISAARMGSDESLDIAGIIDTNKDQIITYTEFYDAVDGCPVPDIETIPIVNTRPLINIDEKPCPNDNTIYLTLRKIAMKFLGGSQLSFDGVKDASIAIYSQITGDIENGMLPKDLDIPSHCIKECFDPLDANENGKLEIEEFQQIAFDVLEEFIPRPKVNRNRVKDSRVVIEPVNSGKPQLPREHVEVLNEATFNTLRMLGRRVPESDLRGLVHTLSQNPEVAAFLSKVHNTADDAAVSRLQNIIKPIIMQTLWEN